jgi:hypothetical protein
VPGVRILLGALVGVSPSGKAPDSDSGIRGFKSYYPSQKKINNVGMSPSGKALDFDSSIRRFESCHPSHFKGKRTHLFLMGKPLMFRGMSPNKKIH